MPIRRLLAKRELGAEETEILIQAFDTALRLLRVVDRNDPLTELVARKVVEVGASGVREPKEIAALAIKRLRIL